METERGLASGNTLDTIVLKYPVEVKGFEKVESLTFRRPKARDLKDVPIEGLKFGDILKLMARLTNQPIPVIEELDAEDLTEASKRVSGFLSNGQETGERAS